MSVVVFQRLGRMNFRLRVQYRAPGLPFFLARLLRVRLGGKGEMRSFSTRLPPSRAWKVTKVLPYRHQMESTKRFIIFPCIVTFLAWNC
jgi:hypothetical protein